jgi:23S rRNA pseudouridine2605 synthase
LEVDNAGKSNHWLFMTLHEGKNREIRKIMDHFNLQVGRLLRIAYGPFALNDLPVGGLQEVDPAVLSEHFGGIAGIKKPKVATVIKPKPGFDASTLPPKKRVKNANHRRKIKR